MIAATVDRSQAAPQNAAPDGPGPNAGTPSATSEATVLAQAALPNAPSGPALVFLSRVTWAAGAESEPLAASGPIGLVVESGTLTIDSPSGIEGRLPAGDSVLFPGEMTVGARNAGDGSVVALLFGVVRDDQRRDRTLADPAAAPRAEPPSANGAVEIAAVDIAWESNGQRTTASAPLTASVTAGQVISLTNRGAVRHTFAVEAFGNVVIDLPFGETVAYTIPTDIEPGAYEFICTAVGHAAAGRVGVLLVQEAAAVAAPTRSEAEDPVEIVGVDIAWEADGARSSVAEPLRVEVAPGQTLSLPNAGAAPHNFAIEAFGDVVVDMPVGETVAYTVPADAAPGEYDFVCTFAGHAAAGMVGVLVVGPPR